MRAGTDRDPSSPRSVEPLGDDLLAEPHAVAADERATGRGKSLDLGASLAAEAAALASAGSDRHDLAAAVLAGVPAVMTSPATPTQLSQM
jgi:hypothetical protein